MRTLQRSTLLVALAVTGCALLAAIASLPGVAQADVSQPVVTNSLPTQAAGAQTDYTVTFNASATGAMSSAAGSQISITGFPAGTDFSHVVADAVRDGTGAGAPTVGFCNEDNTAKSVTCFVNNGSIANNAPVTVEIDGVVNPGAGGYSVSVSTTSDPRPVASSSYTVVAANPISQPVVTNSLPTQAAGAQTDYSVTFNASGTGAFFPTRRSSDLITGFPAGTD